MVDFSGVGVGVEGILPYCQNPGRAVRWSVCNISNICLGLGLPWLNRDLPLLDAITPDLLEEEPIGEEGLDFLLKYLCYGEKRHW